MILRQFFSPEEVAAKKAAAAGLLQRACAEDGGFRQLERLDGKDGHVPIGGCPWSAARVRAGADALPGDPANPGRVTYIDDVHAVDAEMERHARDPKLLGALQHLLGDEIDGYQSKRVTFSICRTSASLTRKASLLQWHSSSSRRSPTLRIMGGTKISWITEAHPETATASVRQNSLRLISPL